MRMLQEGKVTLTMRTPPPKPPTLHELNAAIDLRRYTQPDPRIDSKGITVTIPPKPWWQR